MGGQGEGSQSPEKEDNPQHVSNFRVRRLNVSHLDPMPEGFVPTSYIETTEMFDQPQPVQREKDGHVIIMQLSVKIVLNIVSIIVYTKLPAPPAMLNHVILSS